VALDCIEPMSRAWQDNELGPKELEALVAAVYPQCLPSELRHLQVRMSSSIVENVPSPTLAVTNAATLISKSSKC